MDLIIAGNVVTELKGEEQLYVCNGTDRVALRRLLKHSSVKNTEFARAGRGVLLS